MTDITEIILAIIGLLSAIITGVLVPLITKKIGAEKFEQVSEWVAVAVDAAEQVYKTVEKSGIEKKNYVLDFLQKNNITYDASKIDALIEAAVLRLKKETGTAQN